MTPAPAVTVPAGNGLVNARALDGQLRLIVAQVNALIAALGVARAEDQRLRNGSAKWRMVSEGLKGQIEAMVEQVAAIRATFLPDTLNYTLEGKTLYSFDDGTGDRVFLAGTYPGLYGIVKVPAVIGGDEQVRYRVTFRIRSMSQRTYASEPWFAVRGTVATAGVNVTGVGTVFTEDIIAPWRQPIYVRINGEVRQVVTRPNNTTLTVDTPFSGSFPPGTTMEATTLEIEFPGPLFAPNIHTALPAGAQAQHPFAFLMDAAVESTWYPEAQPFGIPQGRDFLTVSIIRPNGVYRSIGLLTFQPCVDAAPSQHEQRPASRDFIVSFDVNGEDEIQFASLNSDSYAVFYAKSDYPPNDDPRFPALYRFPAGQTAQIDLLSIEPINDPATAILTEAGFPIQGESPQAPLLTE